MKTINNGIVIVLLACQISFAQDYSRDSFDSKNNHYIISRAKDSRAGTSVSISNKENRSKISKNLSGREYEELLSSISSEPNLDTKIKKTIRNVIGERYNQVVGQRIGFVYLIDNKGVVRELSFIVSKNTKLKADDFESLENALKDKLTFTVSERYRSKFEHVKFLKMVFL